MLHKPQRLYGFKGLKYSEGDFAFDNFEWSKKTKQILDSYYTLMTVDDQDKDISLHHYLFLQTQTNGIKALIDDFDLLNKTDDFVAYVTPHDTEDELHIQLRSVTIPKQLFKKVFHDVDYQEIKDNE